MGRHIHSIGGREGSAQGRRRCQPTAEALEPRALLSGEDVVRQPIEPPPSVGAGESAYAPPAAASPVAPAASGPLKTIEGINYDASRFIPPDPNGAAGPGHVVSLVNANIQWHTKSGTLQGSQTLRTFFGPLAPQTSTFDPKVVFDAEANRFVVVALERTDAPAPLTSRVLVAASDDADPNGTWHFQSIDARPAVTSADSWADFPSVAFDAQALYVTANFYSFASTQFTGSRLWILDKSGLYAGGTSAVTVHNPSAAAGLTGQAGTLQPASVYGVAPASLGTFLVSTGWSSEPVDFMSVIRVSNPLTAPTFSNTFINLGLVTEPTVPEVPQPGGAELLDAGVNRALQAVWRNNALWTVSTINPSGGPDAGQATAHWYRVNTASLASPTLSDQGNIGGEDLGPGTHTFFPAVAVDAAGNAGFGFSAAGPEVYASACYTARLVTDPRGTVQPTVRYAAGRDYYARAGEGEDASRWGDFSGISIDPADGTTFWAFNEYALPRGNADVRGDGRWGTRWASFTAAGAVNQAPTIASLSVNPDPVTRNASLTLTAVGVADPDGRVVSVSFYRDANGNGAGEADELLGTDTTAANGWSLTTSASWAAGSHTYLARATDDGTPPLTSGWASATGVVTPPLLADIAPYRAAGWSAPVVVSTHVGTTADDAPFYSDQPLFIDWAFINQGSAAAPVATVGLELRVDGVQVFADVNAVALDPGATVSYFDQPVGPLGPGEHVIELEAHALGITESDESNNLYRRTVTVLPRPQVVARLVFYNNSIADGFDAAAGPGDDAVVAFDKQALRPGQTATRANYTTFSRGINGVMIDVAGLPGGAGLTPSDFLLETGDGAAWFPLAATAAVAVRRGAGASGADRVTLTLADAVARNTWLRITVLPTAATALSAPDVFYFGNLAGDTANDRGAAVVNATDLARTRAAVGRTDSASLDRCDFNRDGIVNAADVLIVRLNQRQSLPLLPAPAAIASTAAPVAPPLARTGNSAAGGQGLAPRHARRDAEPARLIANIRHLRRTTWHDPALLRAVIPLTLAQRLRVLPFTGRE